MVRKGSYSVCVLYHRKPSNSNSGESLDHRRHTLDQMRQLLQGKKSGNYMKLSGALKSKRHARFMHRGQSCSHQVVFISSGGPLELENSLSEWKTARKICRSKMVVTAYWPTKAVKDSKARRLQYR